MALKIGIIGTGGMGSFHVERFREIPDVVVAALHDVDAARAKTVADKFAVPLVARTMDELFDAVDAVAVVTPDRFHCEPAIAALERGKHLLCEKPLAPTLAEAKRMAAAAVAAQGRGIVHMVNFSYRGSGGFAKAIEMARAGALGPIRHVNAWYQQSWLGNSQYGHWTTPGMLWRLSTKAGSGGVLGDLGCHILDMATAIGGDLAKVRCSLRSFEKRTKDGAWVRELNGVELDANDTAIIECDFAGGAIGVVQTSRWVTGHGNHLRCEVSGPDGGVVVDLDRGYSQLDVCLGDDRGKNAWKTEQTADRPSNWWRFVDAIRGKGAVDVDLVRGAQVQAYLDACERSAVSGNWETIAAWR